MTGVKTQKFLPKKSWKKRLLIIVFVLFNIVVIAATAINEYSRSTEATKLENVVLNGWLLIPAVLIFIIATFAYLLRYKLMIEKAFPKSKKPSERELWKTTWRMAMLGRYYDNITPGAIGGQPFQIYYMHKHSGLSRGHATSVPIVGMIVGQIGFLLLAIVFFLVGNPMRDNAVLMIPAWLGLLFYAFWPAVVAGVNFFPKFTKKLFRVFVKIFAKFKLVRNREKALERVENETDEYVKSVKMIIKTRKLFFGTIILSVVYHFLTSCIPFFVLKAFGGNVDFLESFATTLVVTSAVYFVPTPGNAGAAEGAFYIVFSALSAGYVFWAMLIWRFFSYYIYIIFGPITYFFMNLEKKRGEKSEKKEIGGE